MPAPPRPDWFDATLFPFRSQAVEVDGARIHYVDEGEGPTLLLLHGNPTWSFLYRDVIAGLTDRFRCIAPDHPGFGLSTAPSGYGYTIAEHTDVLEGFVDALDLHDVTLMGQDWGGPIGLGVATRQPDRFRAFVLGNTWAWPLTRPDLRLLSRLADGPVGAALLRRANGFVEAILPLLHRRRRLTDGEMAMYRGPFPTPASRRPVQVMPEQLTGAAPLLHDLEQRLAVVADRPALILWGTRDPAFTAADRRRFQATFADHTTVLLEGAGHYLQDDAPAEVVAAIRGWWSRHAALGGGAAVP